MEALGGAAEVLGSPQMWAEIMDARIQHSHRVLTGCCFPSSPHPLGPWGPPQTQLGPQRSGDSLEAARPTLELESLKEMEEKGPLWCPGAPQNPSKPAPSPGPLGADPGLAR